MKTSIFSMSWKLIRITISRQMRFGVIFSLYFPFFSEKVYIIFRRSYNILKIFLNHKPKICLILISKYDFEILQLNDFEKYQVVFKCQWRPGVKWDPNVKLYAKQMIL